MGFLSLMDAKWDLNKYKQLWLLSVLRAAKSVALPGQGASERPAVGDRARLPPGRQGDMVPAILPQGAGMGPPTVLGCHSRHSRAVNSRLHGHPSLTRPSSCGRPPERAAGVMAGLSALLRGASRTVQSWGSPSSPLRPVPLQMRPFPVTHRVAIPKMELARQHDGTQHGGEERGVWPSALANGTWQLVARLLHTRWPVVCISRQAHSVCSCF